MPRRSTAQVSGRRSRPAQLRVLCVRESGQPETDAAWEGVWKEAVAAGLGAAGWGARVEIGVVRYDPLFAGAPGDGAAWRKGFERLLGEPGTTADDGGREAAGRSGESRRWAAGLVAHWATEPALRAAARERLVADVTRFRPGVVVAQGLGALIAYDTFGRPAEAGAALAPALTLVTLATPIHHPYVRDRFGGRLVPLPVRHWFHLLNRKDGGLATPVPLPLARFTQVLTPGEVEGLPDLDAAGLLRHPEAVRTLWRWLADPGATSLSVEVAAIRATADRPGENFAPRDLREAVAFAIGSARRTVARRALLVGINEYPRPEMRLEGCVNDVYLISRRLQELGFAAENVRLVLNDRATATAIRDRLEWLLDGCGDGQGRVFYYSGHGARLPGYGSGETVDRADECLVPHDFDWTPERAVIDNWFYELYSELPPLAQVLAIFDCCHSGGIARDGNARVRGLNPPDDIRHRVLTWDEERGAWGLRTRSAGGRPGDGSVRVRRMFRGTRAPVPGQGRSWDDPAPFGHAGPFFPVILEACGEVQFAHEYRDGATPHGAFTWSLGRVLSRSRRPRSYGELIERVREQLGRLGFVQDPALEGPEGVAGRGIPWSAGAG